MRAGLVHLHAAGGDVGVPFMDEFHAWTVGKVGMWPTNMRALICHHCLAYHHKQTPMPLEPGV